MRNSAGRWNPTRNLALAALLLAAGCAKAADGAGKGTKAFPVSVARVTEEDVPLELYAFGGVEAQSSVDIVSQVTGLVTEVHFKEGDFVKKGAPLFTIDTRPYRASMAVARAELERNQALAEQARVEAERTLKLAEEGVASEQEAVRARAQEQSTAANVKLGRAALESAGINVAFTRITAPIDGRTGTLLVHAGNVVRAGDTQPLVVLRAMSPVQVRFAVPEEYVGRIRERQAKAPLTVRVTAKGAGSKPVEGPLTFLENSVDPATGTLSLKATFANQGLELWPGSAVSVALVLDVDQRATVVPEAAVQEGQSGPYAFVVEGNKARLRKVEVARTTEKLALIRAGLRAGESVVTDGQVRLRDGAEVSVKPSAPAKKNADGGPEASL